MRNIYCKHVRDKKEKSIYVHSLIGFDLNICEKCESKLREQILEQIKFEEGLE